MVKASSEYYCQMETGVFDCIFLVVNHEVENSDHLQVRHGVHERWRSTKDAIEYYQWIISQIQNLQRELGIEVTP